MLRTRVTTFVLLPGNLGHRCQPALQRDRATLAALLAIQPQRVQAEVSTSQLLSNCINAVYVVVFVAKRILLENLWLLFGQMIGAVLHGCLMSLILLSLVLAGRFFDILVHALLLIVRGRVAVARACVCT